MVIKMRKALSDLGLKYTLTVPMIRNASAMTIGQEPVFDFLYSSLKNVFMGVPFLNTDYAFCPTVCPSRPEGRKIRTRMSTAKAKISLYSAPNAPFVKMPR